VQACLHPAIYLRVYLVETGYDYSSESKLPYWYWGFVSTLALVIILPLSVLPVRKRVYELFLASHFVLALVAFLGYYYHIYRRFGRQCGYETWIYIASPSGLLIVWSIFSGLRGMVCLRGM
jgi:hypothetical protein